MQSYNTIKMEHSDTNKRIAKNTVFLYIRMLFVIIVSLYTSRVVLDKLGIEDYGIHNVVAGFVGMLFFFSTSLSNVTQRFLSIELAKKNIQSAKKVFNQHLILYILVILLLLLLAETLGLYFVRYKLVIPSERLSAALWAYQFGLISISFTLIGIVYNSAIIAHEDMKIYSYVGMVEGLANLIIAYIISEVDADRLIVYSFLLMIVVACVQCFYAFYCHHQYDEIKYCWFWDRKTIHHTVSFVGWNFVSTIIYMLKDQALNVLLNIFCGPSVNAARAISYQINSAISNFNSNFVTSVKPQIVKSFAAKDYAYMYLLFYKSSKFSLYLMWLLCLPMMCFLEFVLEIWLKDVPHYTSVFTFWILVDSILATMTNAPWIITMASGNLKRYVLQCNGLLIFIFPASYVALRMGCSPVSVFIIIVFVRIVQISFILYVLNQQIHFGIKNYIRKVVIPVLRVILLSLPIALIIRLTVNNSIIFNLLGIIMVFFISLCLVWLIGLEAEERNFITAHIKRRATDTVTIEN